MTATLYDQTPAERIADENELCRSIVKQIGDFGISQRQRLFLINLLALELENVDHMRSLTTLVRELGGDQLLLVGKPDDEA